MTTITLRLPDAADALAAGLPVPARDFRATGRGPAVAHLQALRAFWVAAGNGWIRTAEKAAAKGDHAAAAEIYGDASEAFAQAALLTPAGA